MVAFFKANILEQALDHIPRGTPAGTPAPTPIFATVKPVVERFNVLKAKKDAGTITHAENAELGLKAIYLAGVPYTKIVASDKYLEISHIMAMEEAWKGAPTRDSLDLFLAYDIASGEGFEIFGIDGFNDVIMTEAGALFGEALQGVSAGVKTVQIRRFESARHFTLNRCGIGRAHYGSMRSFMR